MIDEINKVSTTDLDGLQTQIQTIEEQFNLDLYEYLNELGRKISSYNDFLELQYESYIESQIGQTEDERSNEDVLIREIFKSLTIE